METTDNIPDVNEAEQKSSSNLPLIIIASIVLISVAVGGYFIWKNKTATPKETTSIEQPQVLPQEQLQNALNAAQIAPTIPNLINLGLAYFNNGKYVESIAINTQVLQLDSTNAVAYNNICAAYNNLNRYEEAIYFGKAALRFDANNTLAKNNIAFSEKRIQVITALQQKIKEKTEKRDVIELGLYHYTRKEFGQAISVYELGLATVGEDAVLLNNLCASYCEIKQWDRAIIFGEKAIKIQPDFKLAKNNLQWAKDGKAGKYN
jgi:tetratricopeptide (TPR) repeat protein